MTSPGFSSRSTSITFRQFPHRDEVVMSEQTPGWSNSSDKDEPTPAPAEAEAKVVEPAVSESKTVKKATARKK